MHLPPFNRKPWVTRFAVAVIWVISFAQGWNTSAVPVFVKVVTLWTFLALPVNELFALSIFHIGDALAFLAKLITIFAAIALSLRPKNLTELIIAIPSPQICVGGALHAFFLFGIEVYAQNWGFWAGSVICSVVVLFAYLAVFRVYLGLDQTICNIADAFTLEACSEGISFSTILAFTFWIGTEALVRKLHTELGKGILVVAMLTLKAFIFIWKYFAVRVNKFTNPRFLIYLIVCSASLASSIVRELQTVYIPKSAYSRYIVLVVRRFACLAFIGDWTPNLTMRVFTKAFRVEKKTRNATHTALILHLLTKSWIRGTEPHFRCIKFWLACLASVRIIYQKRSAESKGRLPAVIIDQHICWPAEGTFQESVVKFLAKIR